MHSIKKYLALINIVLLSLTTIAQVGIGTNSPTEELDVVGDIKFSGEIKPSGVSGDNGKVLTAQGAGNSTVWLTATNLLFNNSYQVFGTGSTTISSTGSFTTLSGLSQTVTLTGSAKLLITSEGGLFTTGGNKGHYSEIDIVLFQDGSILTEGGYKRVTAVNNNGSRNTVENWTFSILTNVIAAGTYTWDIRSIKESGEDAVVNGDNSSVLQGSLTIIVIYQ
jgi:hypothetical protein